MNLLNVLNEIEKIDPEVYDRLDGRRAAVKNLAGVGGKLALAAVPLALGSLFSKAYGQSASGKILETLNFALTLEYLEAEYYRRGLAAMNLIPSIDRPAFETIAKHEADHVEFLQTTIRALGGTPVPMPTFDFTAGNGTYNGPLTGIFENYSLYIAIAQTFEDTGVRAYKGQAANLISSNAVLRAALRIHSVEARHAAHVREMRSRRTGDPLVDNMPPLQPWITLDNSGINPPVKAAVQPAYAGEAEVVQAGVNIVGINGFDISREDATEAFDEPLSKDQVLMIVAPFIV